MTTPGVAVLAAERMSDDAISERVKDTLDIFEQEEDAPDVSELKEDPLDVSEPKEVIEDILASEENAEEIEVEDTSVADDAETVILEGIIRAGETFNVGDGVTAKLVKKRGKNVLYFDSKEGTLWHDWYLKLGDNAKIVHIIKFTEDSTVMYLSEDYSCFFGYKYNDLYLHSVEQIQLDNIDM